MFSLAYISFLISALMYVVSASSKLSRYMWQRVSTSKFLGLVPPPLFLPPIRPLTPAETMDDGHVPSEPSNAGIASAHRFGTTA